MKELRIGLIGYQFMGKAHSFAYRNAAMFFDLPVKPVMEMICGRSAAPLKAAQERFGWNRSCTDWKRLVGDPKIDMVDIATPPNIHRDIAVAAAGEGKAVFCEKPLASTLKEAYEMAEAAEKHRIRHAVCFNYRKIPAIGFARKMIEEGRLGKIYHMRAVYLQDWIMNPDFPLVWRLRKIVAGSGAHGDLNAHLIDMARYLVGEFEEVVGMHETFIKERPVLEKSSVLKTGLSERAKTAARRGKVDVDDASLFLARFTNGAVGSFEATRFAAGRKNGQRFEINGSRGSISFNLERLNELEYYNADDPEGTQGFRTIIAMEPSHPYAGNWWPSGHIIGYGESFVNMVADVITAVGRGKKASPDFWDGIRCQRVLEAVEQSVRDGKWARVGR